MSEPTRRPPDHCLACHTALPHARLIVANAWRSPEGLLALLEPVLGAFCNRGCLLTWAQAQPPETAA